MKKANPINIPTKSLEDMFSIVLVIATTDKPEPAYIMQTLEMPSSSLRRNIKKLTDNFMMEFEYVRVKGIIGKAGYYKITNWGIINKRKFLAYFDPEN